MSSYKIYAKKGRKVMPIKIEQKHIYNNLSAGSAIRIYKPNTQATTPDETVGYTVSQYNILVLNNSDNTIISQGPAEDQRIGNKVNIKSISIDLALNFNSAYLIASYSHGELMDTWFNFRVMSVRFKQSMTNNELAQWYRDTFIYYREIDVSAGEKVPYQSNWLDKMRESTPWTGSFELLLDKKFKMSKYKSVRHKIINVPFQGQVNFDNNLNIPTDNQKFNHIYTFLIGPSNAYLDMDPISSDKTVKLSQDYVTLFTVSGNIKTIYYDV